MRGSTEFPPELRQNAITAGLGESDLVFEWDKGCYINLQKALVP